MKAHTLVSAAMALACFGTGATGAPPGENIDPGDEDWQYAYGENVGWINAEPLGNGGPGIQVTHTQLTGWMWSENVGWISLSCENTSSCGRVDYGVTNDRCGGLAGHAWSENAGWIGFAPDHGGVTIDPRTGDFAGHAWGENLGWISFASAAPVRYGVRTSWRRSPPTGHTSLTLHQTGLSTTLSWSVVGDTSAYDVVEGDLNALHWTGDFAGTTTGCAVEDHPATTLRHLVTPDPGEGFWFLVRPVNCGGNGTYDAVGSSQHHPRDAEIDAAAGACE